MKQFGRVTCRQGETRLLLRFVCERLCTFACVQLWMAMMPTPSCAKHWALPSWWDCYLLVTSIASLHTTNGELLPASHFVQALSIAVCWRRLWYNELCTPWPDKSVCFAHLPCLSNYICWWIYSRYPKAYLFFFFSQVYSKACQDVTTGGAEHTAQDKPCLSDRQGTRVCIPLLTFYAVFFISSFTMQTLCGILFL